MIDFSVVICTYNGEVRLPKVLERLRSQLTPPYLQWEILVVDNNSTDGTANLIRQFQQDWPGTSTLRYAFEPRQGLAFARRRAVQTTSGTLIGFLDDDNLPDDQWVMAAYQFGRDHPNVGAYGSEIKGDFEVSPPPNFNQIACCLAIIERGCQPFQYHPKRGVLPAGAGMVIRRQAWVETVPEIPVLAGVCKTSLKTKGEDVETLSYIRQGGWPIWHNPEMKLEHFIPKERLQVDYLLHLFQCIGLSRFPLRMAGYAVWQRPLVILPYLLSDLYKYAISYLRQVSVPSTDVVVACQQVLLLSSLLSPFYYGEQLIFSERQPVASIITRFSRFRRPSSDACI